MAACPAFALQRVSGSSSCLSNSPALAADPVLVNGFSSDQRIRKQCLAVAGILRSSVTVHRHDANTTYSMGDMHRRYPVRYEGCAKHHFPIWAPFSDLGTIFNFRHYFVIRAPFFCFCVHFMILSRFSDFATIPSFSTFSTSVTVFKFCGDF